MTGMQYGILGAYTSKSALYTRRSDIAFISSETPNKTKDTKSSNISKIRQVMRKGSEAVNRTGPTSVIESMQMYSRDLKNQRTKSTDTALAKRKLRYSFKNISSKIISSKTSMSARQVAGQAKREIQKLKNAKRSGRYDSDEVDAAIEHAKAMERIARKKVRHLEEEEMAKRCSSKDEGTCAVDAADIENRSDPIRQEIDGLRKEVRDIEKKAQKEEYIETDEVTNEMLEDITRGMEDMLDEMEELCDLMDELVSNPCNMDPEDLDMLRIKHRNKEMKELLKADAEYLKAMFEHFESEKSPETVAPEASAAIDVAL